MDTGTYIVHNFVGPNPVITLILMHDNNDAKLVFFFFLPITQEVI